MVGFLNHGYHGFSMDTCAKQVGIKKSGLYYYFENKIDLAMQVLTALTKRSVKVICEEKARFLIPDGAHLVILPARLWESGEPKLQQQIRSYYEDWHFNFMGEESYQLATKRAALYRQQFLSWVGYWLMKSIGVSFDSFFDHE